MHSAYKRLLAINSLSMKQIINFNFIKFVLTSLTFVIGTYSISGESKDLSACQDVKSLLAEANNAIGPRPYPLGNYLLHKWEAHKELAQKLWTQRDLSTSLHNLENCVNKFYFLDYTSLKQALNKKLKESSLNQINSINPTKFNEIKSTYSESMFDFTLIVFNGNEPENMKVREFINERSAAYVPHSHTIFKDTAKMNFDDWNAIFLHELGHRLDGIENSIDMVNNKKNFNQMMETVQLYENKKIKLDLEKINFIHSMLWNGLNIGFLAEFRAWLFVVDYLSTGTNYKLGPQTEWLRPFIEEKDTKLQKEKLFQYLDGRFTDENSSIPWMRSDLIKEELKKVRQTLRDSIIK